MRLRATRLNAISGVYKKSFWTPAQLGSPLALWLDAADASTITLNGSTVSQWRDKSGNARHVSQATAANQPTLTAFGLNGKPVVTFDGADWLFNANPGALLRNVPGATVAAVLNYTNFTSQRIPIAAMNNTGTGVRLATILLAAGTLSIAARRLDAEGAMLVSTPPIYTNGTNVIQVGVARYSAGALDQFINGAAGATGSFPSSGNNSDTDSGTLVIGGTSTDDGVTLNANQMLGFVGEVVYTNTALSTTDRQKLEGYLAWKWGLEANLPSDHPYRWDGRAFGFGTAFWSPSSLGSSLALWLDANDASTIALNGSNVSQWSDKSGQGRNISQAVAAQQPAYDAVNRTITFDGSDDYLFNNTTGAGGSTSVSMLTVMRMVTGSVSQDLPMGVGETGTTGTIRSFYRQASGTTVGFAGWATDVSTSDISYDIGGGYHIFAGWNTQLAGPNNVRLSRDGATPIAYSTTGSLGSTADGFSVGSLRGSLVGQFCSHIAVKEVVVLYSAITDNDRQKLEGYLAWKWSNLL
jgi:hypothetical protein